MEKDADVTTADAKKMENLFKTSFLSSSSSLSGKVERTVSLQQNIIMNTLINDIVISKLTGQASIFQLGGLPGSGKTFVAKTIIDRLIQIGLMKVSQVLICCKNNTAVHTVFNTMSDYGDTDTVIKIRETQLKTFHKMFYFPVIRQGMNIKEPLQWSPLRVTKDLEKYANTELLIIDEYMTMRSSEILYIDALFRILRYRPDIPFGGMTVIFLGDNRQNSAVLSNDEITSREKYNNNDDEELCISSSESRLTKYFILQMIEKIFGEETEWVMSLSNTISTKTMNNLKMLIRNLENKIVETRNKKKVGGSGGGGGVKQIKKRRSDANRKLMLDDSIFSDVERAYKQELQPSDYNRNTKNMLRDTITVIEDAIDNRNQNVTNFFSTVSEKMILEKMVLDCLNLRFSDISDARKTRNGETLIENTNRVVLFMNNAMKDIVEFNREKFIVLPNMAEEIEGEGQLLIPEREVLNILIVEGSDPDCLDKRYSTHELGEIKRVINSALFKEGTNLEHFYKLIFKDYSDHVFMLEKVKNDGEFQKYVDKTWDDISLKHNDKNNNISSNNNDIIIIDNKSNSYDYDYDYDDDEDTSGGNFSYGSVINPCEVPDGIDHTYSISQRLCKSIELQKVIREWDSSCIGSRERLVAKARFWFFLKDLVKRELDNTADMTRGAKDGAHRDGGDDINNNDDDRRVYWPPSRHHYHFLRERFMETPYWLRAYTLPFVHNNNSRYLSAYATYISLKAKMFTLNSLKRICLNRHAYGLSYAMAIKDLSTSYTMVDPRTCLCLAHEQPPLPATTKILSIDNKSSTVDFLKKYFETIFPSILKEFLFTNREVIDENKNELYSNIDDELLNKNLEGSKYSELIKLLATEMISTLIYERRQARQDEEIGGGEGKSNNANLRSDTISLSDRIKEMREHIKEEKIIKTLKEIEPPLKKVKVSLNAINDNGNIIINNNNNENNNEINKSNKNSVIVLTKTNNDKNTIAYLVSKFISEKLSLLKDNNNRCVPLITNTNTNNSNIKRSRSSNEEVFESYFFRTIFAIDNNILPSNIHKMSNTLVNKIRSSFILYKKMASGGGAISYINRVVDNKLWSCYDNRLFKNILNSIKTNVTKVDEVFLFIGQKIYFTHTNSSIINFGTNIPFYTYDTGTVVKIVKRSCNDKDGSSPLIVSIAIDRLDGTIIDVSAYKHVEGKASVCFLPVASLLSMTAFSCQGITIRSCVTLINPSRLTAQEMYVALTRNDNVKDIKVVAKTKGELQEMFYLKQMLYSDSSRLYPVGVFGRRFQSLMRDGITPSMTTTTTMAMIDTIQQFVLDKSDNHLSFNQYWFENVEAQLASEGSVNAVLQAIGEIFLTNPSRDLWGLLQMSEEKLIDLFYACYLSVINFERIYEYKFSKGSREFLQFLFEGHGPTDLHRRPPVYVSPVIPRKSMQKIFFDIFPHSRTVAVFQVFANFIFLIYEIINILNIDFAYFPSPSPLTHSSFGCRKCICLNWESEKYRRSRDCGWRQDREPVTEKDKHCQDIVQLGVGNYFSRSRSKQNDDDKRSMRIEQSHVTASVLHNLRRNVKLDRPEEIAGTKIHGAIAVSVDVENFTDAMFHADRKESVTSISYDINIFSMICFNTKLAAACGITRVPFPSRMVDEDGRGLCHYKVTTPEYVLFCGKTSPYKSVQFPIYFNKHNLSVSDNSSDKNKFFNKFLLSKLLRGETLSSIALLWYHSIPSGILGMDPVYVRELICDNNIGILKSVKIIKRIRTLNNEVVKHLTEEEEKNDKNHMVYISIRLK